MIIENVMEPSTQPEPEQVRVDPAKDREQHKVILEISLWKKYDNTLITIQSNLHGKPVKQYAKFKNIYEAVRFYKEEYESSGFSITEMHIYHVHADLFTAEFVAVR